MKKQIHIITILFIMIFVMCSYASAAIISNENIIEFPDDWTVTSATMMDGDISLTFDTAKDSNNTQSNVKTSEYDFSDSPVVISMNTKIDVKNNPQSVSQKFSLRDNNMWHTVNMFKISDNSIVLFGEIFPFEYNKMHNITIVLNHKDIKPNVTVWIDDKIAVKKDIPGGMKKLDMSKVKFDFSNSISGESADSSIWNVNDFNVYKNNTSYKFTSNPINNQQMIIPENLEKISLDFGTIIGCDMGNPDNYELTSKKGNVDFTVESSGTGIDIVLKEKPEEMQEYSLKIKRIEDIYGNLVEENKIIIFTTAISGYKAPVVTENFDYSGKEFYQGEDVYLEYEVDKEIEKLEIYVDGECDFTFTDKPYSYKLNTDITGVKKVVAYAYDKLGGVGKSKETEIVIIENDATVIEVSGITDGASYDAKDIPTVKIVAKDMQGVSLIELYTDDILYKKVDGDSLNADLGFLSGGNHKITIRVTDKYGIVTGSEYNISITAFREVIGYENDFSDYKGKNIVPDGMAGGTQKGYLDVAEIDKEHGKSLIIGIDTANPGYGKFDTAYVGIPAGNITGKAFCDFDMYIDEKPFDRFRLSLKKNGSTEMDFLYITDNMITSPDGSVNINYNTKQWYHIRLKVDIAHNLLQISVTDEVGNEKNAELNIPKELDVLDYIRIFGPYDDKIKSFCAIDNVKCTMIADIPKLIFNDISGENSKFLFDISVAPDKRYVNKETIKVYKGNNEIKIKSVVCKGKTIIVELYENLKSNSKYSVILSENIKTTAGYELGVKVKGTFTTTMSDFEIYNGRYENNKFIFKALNRMNEDKKVFVVTQVWQNNKIKSVKVKKIIVNASSENEYSVNVNNDGQNDYITTYLWDSLVFPRSISSEIYILR